jgi:di/tricarboxylate transporter
MILTLLTLAFAAVFFVWGRLRADLVAMIALLILVLGGVISVPEALSGFSNSIVVMMVGLFIVGGAIFNTGLAKIIGAKLLLLGGNSPFRLFLVVMGATAFIGAFVSNTGTVALMLPIVVSMAAASGIRASRFLMPLAFASSMGGMMTLIGTPPNLIIAEVWEEAGNAPLTFFTFLPGGLICVVAGTLLLIPLSKWFLDKGKSSRSDRANGAKTLTELVEEYNLSTGLFMVSVPERSAIVDRSIGDLNLRALYGVDILEVRRSDRHHKILKKIAQYAPKPTTVIHAGDQIYLRGDMPDVERLVSAYGLVMESDGAQLNDFYDIGLAEIVIMPNSSISRKTVAEIGFRKRFGVNVIAIRRKQIYITADLASVPLQAGDVLLVQGSWEAIGGLDSDPSAWVVIGQPLAEAAKVTLDYKAPLAAAIMVAMIVALIFEFVPPVIAVLCAAMLTILSGCFRNVEDAYKKINWESVVLIAAMMPMSFALEKTGISSLVSSALVGSLGSLGPLPVLAGIYFTTSVMTLFISNTATAVLLAPIAMQSALALDVSALPFLFAVTFGASLCFASPFSTPPNALVMPAGQYTFSDYIKVGLPLQLIMGVIMILLLPVLFPF